MAQWPAGSIKPNKQHFFALLDCLFCCTFTGKPLSAVSFGECLGSVEWNVWGWLQCKGTLDDGCKRIIDWELQETAEVDSSFGFGQLRTQRLRSPCNGLLWIAVNYSTLPAVGAGGGGRVMVVMLVEGDLGAIEVTHSPGRGDHQGQPPSPPQTIPIRK